MTGPKTNAKIVAERGQNRKQRLCWPFLRGDVSVQKHPLPRERGGAGKRGGGRGIGGLGPLLKLSSDVFTTFPVNPEQGLCVKSNRGQEQHLGFYCLDEQIQHGGVAVDGFWSINAQCFHKLYTGAKHFGCQAQKFRIAANHFANFDAMMGAFGGHLLFECSE